jgi:hypothetical protein
LIWESQKVETVIAQSQEYLTAPDIELTPPLRILLNPINVVRAIRLARRLTRHADDATLAEVVPPIFISAFLY